jgi:outer membrane biosynthesis protein TonB
MRRFGPSFLISVLLHAALLALFFVSWVTVAPPITPPSVPVEIVSEIPSREQAAAPVDQNAVLTPQPIPAPEEPVKPTPPPPEPAPKLPVPTPQKAVTPAPKPEKKPEPPKPTPAPPDKNGLRKPAPPKPSKAKPSLDLDALAQLAAAPSRSPTRRQPQANTHATNGLSAVGSGPADAGQKRALAILGRRLSDNWNPNCAVPGANLVNPQISFVLTPNGRALQVNWVNPRGDALWQTGASLAMAAVQKVAAESTDLPADIYGQKITFTFLGEKACEGQ